MLTSDHYIALLEKRASDDSSPLDNREVAYSEYKRNLEDSRKYLGDLFTKADSVQSEQSADAKKLFPSVEGEKQSGNPLMKVARQVFFGSVSGTYLEKTASPIHLELAFRSFCNELEKIGGFPQQTLAQVAAKNKATMARPPKVWDLSSPASAGGAAARMPGGGGTSLHQSGGVLSRAGKALGLLK